MGDTFIRRSVISLLAATLASVPTDASAQLAFARPVPIEDRARATECLALAVAYEAGNESVEGQEAVAEVVLNRVRDPSFPKSVCDVVFAGSSRHTGCQFTFTCDGSLRRRLPERIMKVARIVAEQAIDGLAPSQVFGATHYHADYVTPYWAPTLVRLVKIGAHIFYRGAGGTAAGTPGAAFLADVGAAGGHTDARTAPIARPVFAPWGLTPVASQPTAGR